MLDRHDEMLEMCRRHYKENCLPEVYKYEVILG